MRDRRWIPPVNDLLHEGQRGYRDHSIDTRDIEYPTCKFQFHLRGRVPCFLAIEMIVRSESVSDATPFPLSESCKACGNPRTRMASRRLTPGWSRDAVNRAFDELDCLF